MECLFYLFLLFLMSGGIVFLLPGLPLLAPLALFFIGVLGYTFYVQEESKIGLGVAIIFIGAGFITLLFI